MSEKADREDEPKAGASPRGDFLAEAYTRRPGSSSPPARTGNSNGLAGAAAVALILAAGIAFQLRTAPAAPAQQPPPVMGAAEAMPAQPPAAPVRTAPANVSSLDLAGNLSGPAAVQESDSVRYLWYHSSGRKTEPEQLQEGTRYYGGFYDPTDDGFPLAGDSMEVIVDGKRERMPIKPTSRPGVRKLFVVMPKDGAPHDIVFLPVYDLGRDGFVQVRDTVIDDGHGGLTMISASPVDSIVLRSGNARRRLKLKN